MKATVFTDFFELTSTGSQRHQERFGPRVSCFIEETKKCYLRELDDYLLSYQPHPAMEKVLQPLRNKLHGYLYWLQWLNWNIANLGPVLFQDWKCAAERLAWSTLAYASGRLIDDGFDDHEDFKGHQITLVGFLKAQACDRPPHEACVQSTFIGFHLFHHILRRMQAAGFVEGATELSRLFNIAAIGLLSECHTDSRIGSELYFQIVRRKAVAYNMILYKPFLHDAPENLRNTLLSLLGEMDELAQILNDLGDREEDRLKGKMNISTHVGGSPAHIEEEIGTRVQRLMKIMSLLPEDTRDACAAMLVNIKLDRHLPADHFSLNPTPLPADHFEAHASFNPTTSPSLTTPSSKIRKAISAGVKYLAGIQRPDGEFPTYWSEDLHMNASHFISSPFITGMILFALSEVREEGTQAIREKGLTYLLSRRKDNGYFSFLEEGMDDDLDDTCLLNYLIQQQDDWKEYYWELAERVGKLPRREGLYLTWVRQQGENDVDPCVNLNIIRFLYANGIDCSPAIHALKKIMANGAIFEGTLYYEQAWAFLYFFSSLPCELRGQLITDQELAELLSRQVSAELLHRRTSAGPLNEPAEADPVDQAMRLYCLATAGTAATNVVTALLELQDPAGGWPGYAVFRAFNYWGSPALTTAICIQALQAYQK